MDNVREKLVELLMQVEDNVCDDCGREPVGCAVVAIADHDGSWYKCPVCRKEFSEWEVPPKSRVCPICHKELRWPYE